MNRPAVSVLHGLMFVVLMALALGEACGQPPQVTKTSVTIPKGTYTFVEALALVRKQTGMSFIAGDLPRIGAVPIEFKGTAKETLDALGSIFDYRWSADPRGFVVLAKRFRSPLERPQIHEGDSLEVARAVIQQFRIVGVRPEPGAMPRMLNQLYRSLTPEQRDKANSQAGLPMASLSPAQQRLAAGAAAHNALANLYDDWRLAESQLANLRGSLLRTPPPLPPVNEQGGKRTLHRPLLEFEWSERGRTYRIPLPHVPGIHLKLNRG